ncbi:MAG: xanthine dehydrogenase family protein subunit M [Rhizobiaceae bacterium]|nr:xanthine dehydrogenase family protein subunit M [Rhizobiaceae bacterium]
MTYFRPHDLSQALGWLANNEAQIVAGCTDLFAQTKSQYLEGKSRKKLLDITAISEISGVTHNDDHIRIGAGTSWSEIIAADLPPAFDGLKGAAHEVGSVQIQNSGTIGGNICNASPAADGVPALLTLDAKVELASSTQKRTLPLQEFLLGPSQTALKHNEILCAISIPHNATGGISSFIKLGARKYLVISIAMVGVRLEVDEGKIADIAISVGSCSAVAKRIERVEQLLIGVALDVDLPKIITPDVISSSLAPIDDIRADADYRIKAAREIIIRAVSKLLGAGNKA